MRLINVYTLELKEFNDDEVPPYVILSHRWTREELSFKEYRKCQRRDSAGYKKVREFCAYVAANTPKSSAEWAWVDTVCIDKRSSAELTETINSMWRYYQRSYICVVYLDDVPGGSDKVRPQMRGKVPCGFRESSWFTRGWTLQELLAPAVVVFLSQNWTALGEIHNHFFGFFVSSPREKQSLQLMPDVSDEVSEITQIPKEALVHLRLFSDFGVAQRMSWASRRRTTRIEDEAYCLLGVFGVNMPLIYGEGQKAFYRLQREIIRDSDDQSIFAWTSRETTIGEAHERRSVLATSPRAFAGAGAIERLSGIPSGPYALTNKGLELEAYCAWPKVLAGHTMYLLRLSCGIIPKDPEIPPTTCALLLIQLKCGHFSRVSRHLLAFITDTPTPSEENMIARERMYIHTEKFRPILKNALNTIFWHEEAQKLCIDGQEIQLTSLDNDASSGSSTSSTEDV